MIVVSADNVDATRAGAIRRGVERGALVAKATALVRDLVNEPAGAPRAYTLKSPWKSDAAKPAMTVTAGQAREFQLQPFEVAVWDAAPEIVSQTEPKK